MGLDRIVVLVALTLVMSQMAVAKTTAAAKTTTVVAKTTAAAVTTTAAPGITTAAPKGTTTAATKTTAAKTTTAKPKTTVAKTTAAPITELTGIMELDVTDVDEFERNVKVVAPLQETFAELLGLKVNQVELWAIVEVPTTPGPATTAAATTAAATTAAATTAAATTAAATTAAATTAATTTAAAKTTAATTAPTTTAAAKTTAATTTAKPSKTKRRLGAHAGTVKVPYKLHNAGKTTPKQVAAIAPKIPAKANPKLAKAGLPGSVKKAHMKPPVATKKPANPCAPVVTKAPVAPVAPAAPCAPVVTPAPIASPCAVIGVGVKYSEHKAVAPAVAAPGLSPLLLLAVPSLAGLSAFIIARKIKARYSADDTDVVEDEEAALLE